MHVAITYDNQSQKPEFSSGWGLSCFVGRNTLFDTGEDGPALLNNLHNLHISLDQIERVVISHDHWDHWGGLWDLLQQKPGLSVIGCPGFSDEFAIRVAENGGNLEAVDAMIEVEAGVFISKPFATDYKDGTLVERAVYCKTMKGISVITGCAHPGILQFAENAVETFPQQQPYTALGGFHLGALEKVEIDQIIAELQRLRFSRIIPTHCSGEYAAGLGTERSWSGKVLEL